MPARRANAWLRDRPTLAAALVYGALSVLLYAPALLPGNTLSASDYLWTAAPWTAQKPADVRPFGSNFELIDSVTQFQPWTRYARERLPDVPLWNPHVGGGRPFLANAQSAVFSPFALPSYVLPFWWSLGLVAVLKVWVAALGTFALGRALGLRFGGALLAGLAYAFSLFFLVWISWPQTSVWALLPLLLLVTERALRRPGPLSAAALAAVVAWQFLGGHPESSFHIVLLAVAFFAFRVMVRRRQGAEVATGRALVVFGGGLALGALLAAATLVPLLELLGLSNDVDVRKDFWKIDMPREYLLGFALADYWGRGTEQPIGAFAQGRALYVGAGPLLLAGIALIVRPSLQRLATAGLALAMLAIVVGLPPFPQVIRHLPIVETGNHIRLVIVVMLCVALLAGRGLDDLSARRPIPRRGLVLALAGLLVLGPVLVLAARGQLAPGLLGGALETAWGFASPPSPLRDPDAAGIIRLASLLVWLPFVLGAVALVAARMRGRLGPSAWVALTVLLLAADLFRAGMGQTPAIATDEAEPPSTPALDFLRAQVPRRFAGLQRPLGPPPLIPNTAIDRELQDARSYDVPVERRYDELWRRAVQDGPSTDFPTSRAVATPRALPVLSLLGVAHLVQDPAERPLARPGLRLAYDGPDARVYANPRALPRALVVDAQRIVASEDAELDALLAPGFDPRRSLVTASPLPGLGTAPGRGPAGRARIVSHDDPERVVVQAVARRPSALVLSDTWYPGWKARVGGREADVRRVDWMLRGVSLPPGRHTVEFSYEPASWRIGWIGSLVGLVVLAALLVAGRRATVRGWARSGSGPGPRGPGSRPAT